MTDYNYRLAFLRFARNQQKVEEVFQTAKKFSNYPMGVQLNSNGSYEVYIYGSSADPVPSSIIVNVPIYEELLDIYYYNKGLEDMLRALEATLQRS